MFKRLLALLLLISCTTVFAFDLADQDCREMYQSVARSKMQRKANFFNGSSGQAYGGTVSLGFAFTVGSSPIALATSGAILLLMAATITWIVTDPKEQRALNFEVQSSRFAKRLMKKAKRILPDVRADELDQILQEGFDSGEFCKNGRKKLYGPRKVSNYVLNVLKHSEFQQEFHYSNY